MMDFEITPQLLRKIRRRKGMNQEEFAKLIGVNISTVARWEAEVLDPNRMRNRNYKKILDMAVELFGKEIEQKKFPKSDTR